MKCEVSSAMDIHVVTSWGLIQGSVVGGYQRFREVCRLYHQLKTL